MFRIIFCQDGDVGASSVFTGSPVEVIAATARAVVLCDDAFLVYDAS